MFIPKSIKIICTYSAACLYPIFVYALIDKIPTYAFILIALILLLVRTNSFRNNQLFNGLNTAILILLAVCGPVFIGISFWQPRMGVLIYPVIVNFIMATLFATTLIKGPPLIERIASLRESNIDVSAQFYMRRLTVVWSSFCAMNGLIALGTVLCDNTYIWVLYNGVLSYVLIGMLLVGERIFRSFWKSLVLKKRKML